MQYYILFEGQQLGPMNKEELVKYNLKGDTMVWSQNLPEWTPAANVPELAAMLQPAPQPQAAAQPVAEWFVVINGQQSGPHPASSLASMGVKHDTMAWKNGMSDWKKVGEIAELCVLIPGGAPMQPGMYQNQYAQNISNMGTRVSGAVQQSNVKTLAIISLIVGAIFCCLIGGAPGLVALLNCNKIDQMRANGQIAEAENLEKQSKTWAFVGFGLAGLGFIINIVSFIIGLAQGL